jgi:hypothetical protein
MKNDLLFHEKDVQFHIFDVLDFSARKHSLLISSSIPSTSRVFFFFSFSEKNQ